MAKSGSIALRLAERVRRLLVPEVVERRDAAQECPLRFRLRRSPEGDRAAEPFLQAYGNAMRSSSRSLAWGRDSIGCRLPVAGCRLPVAGCRLPVAGCRLPVAGLPGCRVARLPGRQPPAASRQSATAG